MVRKKTENGGGKARRKLSAEEFAGALRKIKTNFDENPNSDLLKLFEEEKVSSPLIFSGTETVRIRRLIQWIRKNFFGNTTEASIGAYFGSDLTSTKSIQEVVASLGALSLFAKTQLIIIYDADKIKSAAAKPLIEALKKNNPSSLVILTASKLNQQVSINKLTPNATLIDVKELKGAALKKWMAKDVARAGATGGIAEDAQELLIRIHGNNVTALSQEITKLGLLTDESGKITKSLVLQILNKSPERTSFELVAQIAKKNALAAESLTKNLLTQGLHPLQLSNFLTRSIRTMLANKESGGQAPGGPNTELSNPWFLRNLTNAMNTRSKKALIKDLETLKTLDLELKSNHYTPPLAMSLAIQKMVGTQN